MYTRELLIIFITHVVSLPVLVCLKDFRIDSLVYVVSGNFTTLRYNKYWYMFSHPLSLYKSKHWQSPDTAPEERHQSSVTSQTALGRSAIVTSLIVFEASWDLIAVSSVNSVSAWLSKLALPLEQYTKLSRTFDKAHFQITTTATSPIIWSSSFPPPNTYWFCGAFGPLKFFLFALVHAIFHPSSWVTHLFRTTLIHSTI